MRSGFQWVVAVVVLIFSFVAVDAALAEPSDREKLHLKSVVVDHIDANTEDGIYYFVPENGEILLELQFATMHPVIFTHPDGMYVLCADFKNADGRRFLIDYYVKKIGEDFIVLSSIEGKRSILSKIAERFSM